jgi:hypothetical protein
MLFFLNPALTKMSIPALFKDTNQLYIFNARLISDEEVEAKQVDIANSSFFFLLIFSSKVVEFC